MRTEGRYLYGLALVHFDDMEVKAVDPFSWGQKHRFEREVVSNVHEDLRERHKEECKPEAVVSNRIKIQIQSKKETQGRLLFHRERRSSPPSGFKIPPKPANDPAITPGITSDQFQAFLPMLCR